MVAVTWGARPTPRTIVASVSHSKLRITILGLNYTPEPTGNAPYTTGLAEGLAAAGHQVQVVTGFPHYPEWSARPGYPGWSRSESLNGVKVKRLRHHIPASPTPLSRLHMELSFGVRLIFTRWNRPDVVLVVSPALFSSALALLRLRLHRKRPAVGIWVQDLYSRGILETGSGQGRIAGVALRLEAAILRSCDGVVAIHDRFRTYIVDTLGVPPTRVKVIRNWTHLPETPASGQAAMRARLRWNDDDIVVLHAGNMGKKQGLENVINAARLAQRRGSRVRFVLMGDGNQRKHLQSLASGMGHIDFIPPLPGDEFLLALAAADVLLVNELPDVKEMAVPSKLTSYFNAGVPVLAATDAESVTAMEISASGGGLRVDPADPSALLEAAEALGGDRNRAQMLAANALRFRNEILSEQAAIGHYDEFVSSLASLRGR